MVLKSRILSAFSLFAPLLLVAACMKQPVITKAPHESPVAIAAVLEMAGKREIQVAPPALIKGITHQATIRDLKNQELPASEWLQDFDQKRATNHRMAQLAEKATSAELILLVETMPEFYSQLNGRYRWTVNVEITIAPREQLDQAISSEFKVPVFMQFDHEREPEALKAAIPIIERHLGYLLDEYIGGMK